jgi:hypothetical protein
MSLTLTNHIYGYIMCYCLQCCVMGTLSYPFDHPPSLPTTLVLYVLSSQAFVSSRSQERWRLLLQVRQDLWLEQRVGLGRRVPPAELDIRAVAPGLWMVGWSRGQLGGQIWELEPMAVGSGLRAPRRRWSILPAFVVLYSGAWLVAGLVRSSPSPCRAADAGGMC